MTHDHDDDALDEELPPLAAAPKPAPSSFIEVDRHCLAW